MKINLKKIMLLSVLFTNILNRDINIELFKNESNKNKGNEKIKINSVLITDTDLEKGFLSDYNEDFFYLTVDNNNKPFINNEKMGVQYGIKKINDEDYILDINIKTDKTLETSEEEIIINRFQKSQKISDFKIKSKTIEAKIIREKEKIVIEIGKDYFLNIEKITPQTTKEIKK